ncbi:uncharacterized protein UV8b_00718 [Ustilaginoidea virens]|uniref:Uncharacterized protein n=1 Tax=Ustilaginoidea virens TaxID=1159556 RepID=A0A063BXB9_USTVR|nr:uncharacterized protein UV8b_00718 [Ustilaginoidea virens]QUC16477.1 hypothetical protein UV8b_00718 [Ustilaginoidea virens]GAO13309.1 hypothetical protein UVI_02013230 [Ustilaginoidea virens]
MYGSYGSSYSSMSTMSAPLDIPFNSIRSRDSSCAFPSWPRRSSLSDSEHEEPRATSYLSDDDLFLSDSCDDDNRSVSSYSSSSSPATVALNPGPHVSEEEFLRMEYERVAVQKEYLRQVKLEKERRRQAALRARKSNPKRSPKSKQTSLTTITESSE